MVVLIEKLHQKTFHHSMSDEMKLFLENLSFSFFLGILTSGILFIVNVSAGRIFGPVGYGEYNYFLSLATSSTFFFLLGNNLSSTRFISDQNYKERKNSILTAAIFLTLIQAIIFFTVVYFLRDYFGSKFSLNNFSILLVFSFGLVFSFRELFDSFLRAFSFFKRQSTIKFFDSVFVILTFFLFYYFSREEFVYAHYATALIVGALVSLLAAIYLLRNKLSSFAWNDIVLLLHYNKYLILAGISGLILSSEKVWIGKYIGNVELGIYSAYYASSQTVISAIAIVFMNIFWPVVIKNKDNLKPVLEKLDILFFRYFILWLLLNIMSGSFFLSFFGNEYPFQWTPMILFSIVSLLNIMFFVFMGILNIDQIGKATLINMVIYGCMISSIVLFRNVSAYLIVQTMIYILATLYVRRNIRINYFSSV